MYALWQRLNYVLCEAESGVQREGAQVREQRLDAAHNGHHFFVVAGVALERELV